MMNEISAFCSGYITALNAAGVEWNEWLIPHSIHCCSIHMRRAADGYNVDVIVLYVGGKREEFFMVERENMFGDPEWVKVDKE